MKRKDFIAKINIVRKKLHKRHSYVCLFLSNTFDKNYLGHVSVTPISLLYRSVIRGFDNRHTGMFGAASAYHIGFDVCFMSKIEVEKSRIRHENRKFSLDIFERVALDEGLYKDL